MKKILLLSIILIVIGFSDIHAQSCPTGLQDCYIKGALSGSSYSAVGGYKDMNFAITSGGFCPSGRFDCSSTATYTVTVTRLSGSGKIRLNGGSYTTSAGVSYHFDLGICGETQNFVIGFMRSSISTTWSIALTNVENGRVCNSGTYIVTLSSAKAEL